MSSKSSNKTSCSRSNSTRSKHGSRVISQTPIDAKLHEEFEESNQEFDYSTSIAVNLSSSTTNVPSSTVSTYLQKIQRGQLIQPFGCMIAIDEENFSLLAYSENAPEMLDLSPLAVPSIDRQEALTFGTDVRSLFQTSGATALQKASKIKEVNLLNPILLHCKTSGKPFYAILHRNDVGLVIDLEPVNPADVPVSAAGALKSYKLAAKSISRLQSLPSRNISLLCDVLAKEVSDLTGYERVMVYKFHEDEHGEVLAECHGPNLEPYLGLHYPATDIPQASRFLFMKNKVRMICDCLASQVKVVQDNKLAQPLSLCGSILRSPHGCHGQYMANMGTVASLVMAVTIDDDDNEVESDHQRGRKLWGLVVCHHSSPRFIPFPLRYACEFLIQVFCIQVNKEVELGAQLREKHILQTQTVLCDMLLRDVPVGIVTQSPNIMDLVKCDGAALYYKKKFWALGITPTEAQIRDLADWLVQNHGGSTGLSTDSLMEAGYPGASGLGNEVCGVAAIKITAKDFLFWFRSHMAKEIKWGGAKHDPNDKDDGRKMHPRSSFKAFLEVVKQRSSPWEDVEMDAIHSLQVIMRGSLQDEIEEDSKMIVNVVPLADDRIQSLDELRVITNEMVRLIETAVVPILAVDSMGVINGWNSKACELTGLPIQQAISRLFVDVVADESVGVVKNMLSLGLQGIEEQNVEIKLKTHGPQQRNDSVILVVNACCSRDVKGNIVGSCFIGQDVTQKRLIMDRYTRMKGDYVGIMQSPSTLIPPIFMTDEHGRCVEWNDAMEKLSGLKREETIEKMLLGEVFTDSSIGCRVKDQDTLTTLKILFNRVVSNQNVDKLLFGFFDQQNNYVEALLSADKRVDGEGRITRVLCFLHVASPELKYAIYMQKISEQSADDSIKKLAYIRGEIRKPLSGIKFMQNLMDSSDLSSEQKQLLKISTSCQDQLIKIVDDSDIENLDECFMEVNSCEFNLGDVLEVVMNQVMISGQERHMEVVLDSRSDASSLRLYGDNLRLQQVLSNFMSNAVLFVPAFEGSSVSLEVIPTKNCIGSKICVVHLEFRIVHPLPGIPENLIKEMFHHDNNASREGLGLHISHKLVKIMNGTVQYLREAERSSFIIRIEFPLVNKINK